MFTHGGAVQTASKTNPMSDFEVTSPPDDSISSLAFSPSSIPNNFLVAGSWDCNVRCWEVEQTGKTIPKSMQSMSGPILDVCWSDVGFIFKRLVFYLVSFFFTTVNKFILLCFRTVLKCSWHPVTKWSNVGI